MRNTHKLDGIIIIATNSFSDSTKSTEDILLELITADGLLLHQKDVKMKSKQVSAVRKEDK